MKNSFRSLLGLSALLIGGISVFFACQKEVGHKADCDTEAIHSIADRNSPFLNLEWLETFQADLVAALDQQAISTTYTPSEAALGVEALIMIASPTTQTQRLHISTETNVVLNNANSAQLLKELYTASYDFFLNHYQSFDSIEALPVMIDIQLVETIGLNSTYKVKSVMGLSNICIEETYGGETTTSNVPCDGYVEEPFGADDGFRMGFGDEELELFTAFLPSDCETACGPLAVCELGETTAPEQVEAAINHRFPLPISPYPNKPYFWGFVDIECTPQYETLDGLDDYIKLNCGLYNNHVVGYCMETDELNCVYCAIFDGIELRESPFDIPEGKYFVSLNLATDMCACADLSFCQKWTEIIGAMCWGTPVFGHFPKPNFPGWNEPTTAVVIDPNP